MDDFRDAAVQAAELIPSALSTLDQLMRADEQPGPVRVAAAKAVIDYAIKLRDNRSDTDSSLAKLDQLLAEYRREFGFEE